MTEAEVKSAVEQLKSQGLDEGKIIGGFFGMYKAGELDLNAFEAIADIMGYKLTDEFKAKPEDEKKKMDWDFSDNPETEEDNEKAPKELSEDEGDKPEAAPKGGVEADEDKKDDESDESDEEEKAMKLFGNK